MHQEDFGTKGQLQGTWCGEHQPLSHLTGLWHQAQAEQEELVPVGLQLPVEDALEDGIPCPVQPLPHPLPSWGALNPYLLHQLGILLCNTCTLGGVRKG